MANIIQLSIKTADKYTETEKLDLLEAFVEFIGEMDGSIIEDSEEITVTDENDAIDDDVKSKAIEMLKNGTLTVSVAISDEDDSELLSTGEVSIAIA